MKTNSALRRSGEMAGGRADGADPLRPVIPQSCDARAFDSCACIRGLDVSGLGRSLRLGPMLRETRPQILQAEGFGGAQVESGNGIRPIGCEDGIHYRRVRLPRWAEAAKIDSIIGLGFWCSAGCSVLRFIRILMMRNGLRQTNNWFFGCSQSSAKRYSKSVRVRLRANPCSPKTSAMVLALRCCSSQIFSSTVPGAMSR
jgi:hypothetical protein